MSRIFAGIFMMVVLMAQMASAENQIVGKWRLIEQAKDSQGNPCPYVPNHYEFFKDGTVGMDNLPPGMKMLYRATLTPQETRAIIEKAPELKGKGRILLLKPSPQMDWKDAMPYRIDIKNNELMMELPDWTPAKYIREK